MPATALTSTPNEANKAKALLPLVDADLNGDFDEELAEFGKTVFGEEAWTKAREDRKAERAGMAMNGGIEAVHVCTSLMRTYVILKGFGEMENAEGLKVLATGKYGEDVVKDAIVKVENGL